MTNVAPTPNASCTLDQGKQYNGLGGTFLSESLQPTASLCSRECASLGSGWFTHTATSFVCKCIQSDGYASVDDADWNSGPVCYTLDGVCPTILGVGNEVQYHLMSEADLVTRPFGAAAYSPYPDCDTRMRVPNFPENEIRDGYYSVAKDTGKCTPTQQLALSSPDWQTVTVSDARSDCDADVSCNYLQLRTVDAYERTVSYRKYAACVEFEQTGDLDYSLYRKGHSQANGLDCCKASRTDSMATHYYHMPSSTTMETRSASKAFGPGVPFGTGHTSEMIFVFDFNLDGYDDVVIGNKIFMSGSPYGDGSTLTNTDAEHSWFSRMHTGRPFATKPIIAMGAIVSNPPTTELGWPSAASVLSGSACAAGYDQYDNLGNDVSGSNNVCPSSHPVCIGYVFDVSNVVWGTCHSTIPYGTQSVMVSIAYEDHSVVLYSIERFPHVDAISPDVVRLRYNATISASDYGTPTSVTMYVRERSENILYTRIGTLVTYSDADDLIYYADMPSVENRIAGKVELHGSMPVSKAGAISGNPIPSICSGSIPLPTKQPFSTENAPSPPPPPIGADPIFVGPVDIYSWIDLFVVGTSKEYPNLFYIEMESDSIRSFPDSVNEESVAVATYRFYDSTNSKYVFAVCFANTNAQNHCYKFEVADGTLSSKNALISDITNSENSQSHFFGDKNEHTSDIKFCDANNDGYVDIITIENGGYTRIYRGSAYTESTMDFSVVVPETLDSRAAQPVGGEAGRRLQSLPYSIFPGNVEGHERFLRRSKLGIGRVAHARINHPTSAWYPDPMSFSAPSITQFPSASVSLFRGLYKVGTDKDVRFIITHHVVPDNTDGSSCAMQCHRIGRMGFDSFKLFEPNVVTALDPIDRAFYYENGQETECLCGSRYDVITAPHPPPLCALAHPETERARVFSLYAVFMSQASRHSSTTVFTGAVSTIADPWSAASVAAFPDFEVRKTSQILRLTLLLTHPSNAIAGLWAFVRYIPRQILRQLPRRFLRCLRGLRLHHRCAQPQA